MSLKLANSLMNKNVGTMVARACQRSLTTTSTQNHLPAVITNGESSFMANGPQPAVITSTDWSYMAGPSGIISYYYLGTLNFFKLIGKT